MRRAGIILAVSAAANLLLLGIIAGLLLRPAPETRLREVGGALPFFAALPPEAREAMGQALRDQRPPRPEREAIRERFEALLAVLRAEPFDAAAVASLLQGQRQAAVARQERGEALLVSQLGEMGGAERAAYAERLEEMLRRGPPRGGRENGPRRRDD